jgi:hypothetical protein
MRRGKEAEMFQIPEGRAITKLALLVLITLGAGSCGDRDCSSLNLNPHVHPLKTAKQTRPVPCDTTINADVNTGGVDLDAAFLCEKDLVTWQIGKPHTFQVVFKAGSPFKGGKSQFSDQDPSGYVKDQYDKLEVYKYSITVDNKPTVDPQVIGGGNP